MALDIQNGDQLVIGSDIYAIRAVSHYNDHGFGASKSFARMASVSCTTNRRGAVAGGVSPAPTQKLTGLSCVPLSTVTPETRQTPITNTPVVILVTFITDGTDYARLELQESKQ